MAATKEAKMTTSHLVLCLCASALLVIPTKPPRRSQLRRVFSRVWPTVIVDDTEPIMSHAGYTTEHNAVWQLWRGKDRKSTRLNSSHVRISYAVFCLKKKKKKTNIIKTW